MNATTNIMEAAQTKAVTAWFEKNQFAAVRGIDESTWNALCNSVFPGAAADSVLMAWDYCAARGLDILLKPVHIVPMSVKNAKTKNYEWRDVVMPGVGLYRIQADRSGTYAGCDDPEFGPEIEATFGKGDKQVTIKFPEWCRYTVYKTVNGEVRSFTAKEFWLENYATSGKETDAPNAMWARRKYGQLAKCTEAQALRKAWPDIGQEPTAEEMEGKSYERDITPEVGPAIVMPQDRQEPASATKQQESARAADGELTLAEGQVRMITKKAQEAGVGLPFVAMRFGVDRIEQIAISKANEVLALIKNGAQ